MTYDVFGGMLNLAQFNSIEFSVHDKFFYLGIVKLIKPLTCPTVAI